MQVLQGCRDKARLLKRDTCALYLVCRDPLVPWTTKALAGSVVAYAFSPIEWSAVSTKYGHR